MIIVIQCSDRIGLVAAISGVLAEEQLNIVSMREHVDKIGNRFFMRLELEQETPAATSQKSEGPEKSEAPGKNAAPEETLVPEKYWALEKKMQALLPPEAVITVNPLPEKKVVVLVGKEYHCLADILVRHYFSTLGVLVQCVIGNHPDLRDICQRFDIPFYLVPHGADRKEPPEEGGQGCAADRKEEFERRILEIIKGFAPDYIVLAKFMRILSPRVVTAFPMRIINIHHSFLPAFAGAHPYRQAFERGVKLIGATAHFVTGELDEGPIIAQQIISVNHSYTAPDMIEAGKEIETSVLARALRLVVEDRVFVYGNKTVVFE